MDLQSLIMLIISALTTVYLFYALLRPEKFWPRPGKQGLSGFL